VPMKGYATDVLVSDSSKAALKYLMVDVRFDRIDSDFRLPSFVPTTVTTSSNTYA
jgi:hypothetical protein